MPRPSPARDEMATTPWSKVLLLYAAGLIASCFLGKIAPIGPPLQEDLGLTLAELGWAVSSITAITAIFGAGVGAWLPRLGAKRALVLGLVILSGAGMLTAAGASADLMIAARTGEGFGYLLVVVAAPTLIVRLSRGPDQATALAIWGTFVPVGLAIGAFAGGGAASAIGWRGWLGLVGVPPAVAVALVMLAIPPDESAPPSATARKGPSGLRPLLALAAAFGCIGLAGVVVVALLPTFLVEARGAALAAAGAATAITSLASVPGSLLAGWAMRRGAGLRSLSPCSLLMPLAAIPVFVGGGPVALVVAAAAIVLLANGIVVSALFAAVPRLARDPARIALGNGLVAQLGSLGTLLGPPLFGSGIAAFGWHAVPALLLAFTLLGVALALAAEAAGKRADHG
jgi:predicted MFS family arabinose efflux permease